nr:MAG TPA: hypothetical protein [Caudoviricetes sp.]
MRLGMLFARNQLYEHVFPTAYRPTAIHHSNPLPVSLPSVVLNPVKVGLDIAQLV